MVEQIDTRRERKKQTLGYDIGTTVAEVLVIAVVVFGTGWAILIQGESAATPAAFVVFLVIAAGCVHAWAYLRSPKTIVIDEDWLTAVWRGGRHRSWQLGQLRQRTPTGLWARLLGAQEVLDEHGVLAFRLWLEMIGSKMLLARIDESKGS